MGGSSGSSKGKGGAPAPPDFMAGARSQSDTTRPNWGGPTASQSWSYGPDGRPTMSLSTPFQGAFDALTGATQSAAGLDPTQARNQAIGSNLDWGMSRLNPLLSQQQGQFDARMANSGQQAGMEGYGNAARQLGQNQSDMFRNMMQGAINQGNQTQGVMQQQQMLPFQQLASLTGSVMAHPYMGSGAPLLQGMADNYSAANRQWAQGGSMGENIADLMGLPGQISDLGRSLQGKGKGFI